MKTFTFLITITFTYLTKSHAVNLEASVLNPVRGLYVKPSDDGITGDLYVAATEDNGVTSQWLTDHPINFLPSSNQPQATAIPIPVTYTSSFATSSSPHEETVTTKKRAVITSPAVKYAYAFPGSGTPNEGNAISPYPYVYYAANPPNPDGTQCWQEGALTTGIPQYPAFPYYPQMMTALANAMTTLKEDKDTSGSSKSKTPHHAWPAAYAYPFQYFMVDPTSWAQHQPSTTSAQTTTDVSANEEE